MRLSDSKVEKIKVSEYSGFIEKIDRDFINPMIGRSYFPGYYEFATKLLDSGVTVYIKDSIDLVAATTFYADPKKYDYAHVPFTGVLASYRGKGLSSLLLNRRNELIKDLGMKGVISSCAKNNVKMRRALEGSGYELVEDQEYIVTLKNVNRKDDWDKAFYVLNFQ